MKAYQTIIIFKPNLIKDYYNTMANFYKDILKVKLKAHRIKTEQMGLRHLAYDIKGEKEGYYMLFTYQIDKEFEPKIGKELELSLRANDSVIKFLTVGSIESGDYTPDPDQDADDDKTEQKKIDYFDLIFNI